MQNLFQQLKSEYQERLISKQEEYSSINILIAKFESKTLWSDITIGDLNNFCIWADINPLECSIFDIKYGDKFLKSK